VQIGRGAVVAGVPALVIRDRFDRDQIREHERVLRTGEGGSET
jgi:acetyltransferase-like isoleucine patch superfamily enzyme